MNALVPYLSTVGWVRNDGYTESYVDRIRRAVEILAGQLERHAIPSEILLVEWNPPGDRPLMADLFADFAKYQHITVKFVVVDGRYHRGLIGSNLKGMHVMNAANVGVRRARGRFIIPKAIDTFFTEPLVARIGRQDLEEDCVYRCDRYDVEFKSDSWLQLSEEELLATMASQIILRHDKIDQKPEWALRDLHTNACGDFTLMASQHWQAIRGFPDDRTVLCLDADSIALHAAAAHGVREVCWPDDCRVYKITHGMVFHQRVSQEWQPWQRKLDDFVTQYFKPEMRMRMRIALDYPRRRVRGLDGLLGPSIERNFVGKAQRYARNDTSVVTNSADWGLANAELPVRTVAKAAWDTGADA